MERGFFAQLGGATLIELYSFGFTFVVFEIVNAITLLCVSKETEQEGLDVPEFGLPAYPEDALAQ